MTYEELVDFLENRMRMSHIYQPLLIRSLVDAGGAATIRQLAQAFLVQDESQILFYEKRIKQMPLKVLKSHDIVMQQGELVTLNTKPLDFQQRLSIKMICDEKMQEFLMKKGLSLWDYRLGEMDPVPDSLRYQALMASGGRCALCGATKEERPLDVDHIIPRSRAGKNVLSNLQILCSKCNRSKGNKDATDFRESISPDREPSCGFCSPPHIEEENKTVYAILDKHPVTQGHRLIIPFRHTPDYLHMTAQERTDADDLIRYLSNKLMGEDAAILGFNIGMNCGETAGQSVFHAHTHLIPRRAGDTERPKGGVRGVIPTKMAY